MNQLIDENTKEIIGYNEIIKTLELMSPYGKKRFNSLKPFSQNQVNELNQEYDYISLFIEEITKNNEQIEKMLIILHNLKDIQGTIESDLEIKTLDLVELYELKILAMSMNELNPLINVEDFKLKDCSPIIKILSEEHKSPTKDFYLYSSYSDYLKEIRTEKRTIEQTFFKTTDPIKKEALKQKRSEYVIKEEEEELRVRKLLTNQLKDYIHILQANIKKIAHIDCLIAKAKLALRHQATKPVIKEELKLIEMVHPFIEEEVNKLGNHYTKNSIELNKGTTVITGANMGGKSSLLKTVSLNLLLAQMGFFVFAKEAEIPLVDHIQYIGVYHEQAHGLSSFGLEIHYLNQAIKSLKAKKCLLVVDEFARSTNPSEGQKFVSALADFTNQYSSFTLLATHYDGVVKKGMSHYQISGLKEEAKQAKNHKHTVNEINQYMDYSLKRVSDLETVPKEAYQVSLLLELDEDYKAYLDKSYRE